MKKIRFLLISILVASFSFACKKDDEQVPGVTLYEQNGSWNCELGKSCQDIYEFKFAAGTRISITVEEVTGLSVARLAVHAPGIVPGGTNLLTNNANDLMCSGQNEDMGLPNVILPSEGTYKVAITRDWGTSAGVDGDYRLAIFADKPFEVLSQTNDTDSLAPNGECP